MKSVTIDCSHERVHCKDMDDCEENSQAYVELIRRDIKLEGALDEEQRKRVAQIARRCPVHRTLESVPRIDDQWVFSS